MQHKKQSTFRHKSFRNNDEHLSSSEESEHCYPIFDLTFDGYCDHREFYVREFKDRHSKTVFSFGTYANTFFVDYWQRYTKAKDLSLKIAGSGSAIVKVMMRKWCWTPKLVAQLEVQFGADYREAVLPLPHLGSYPQHSRLNVVVESLDGSAHIGELSFTTTTPPSDAKIAILLRTYGRPADVLRVIDLLSQCLPCPHSDFFVIILDTSEIGKHIDSTLISDDFNDGNFLLLRAPNFGSGGNVSLGLLITKYLPNFSPTDILVLDDDVAIDPCVITRYAAVCAYRKENMLVSGSILSKKDPHLIYETAALYGRRLGHPKQAENGLPTALSPCNYESNTLDPVILDRLGLPVDCNYSAFVFFGFPAKMLDSAGFPAPFFLKGDDVEYSLRLGHHKCPTVPWPGLYAWHDPYWVSHSINAEYLAFLHMNILATAHLAVSAVAVVNCFMERIEEHLRHFDYFGAKVYLRSWETFLNPPDELVTAGFCEWYEETISSAKRVYAEETVSLPPAAASHLWDFWRAKPAKPRKRYRIAMLVTGFGHFTPSFLRRSTYCAFTYYNDRFPRTLWAKSVVMANPVSGENRVCHPDNGQFRALTKKARELSRATYARYASIKKIWTHRLSIASSEKFWCDMSASRQADFAFGKGDSQSYEAFMRAVGTVIPPRNGHDSGTLDV